MPPYCCSSPNSGTRYPIPSGPDRRPYDLPLGTLPTLPALGRRSFRRGRHPHLYDTHVELFGQTDMGLRHLLADDDRLHRHQRPLWGDAGRGDRRFARTDGILLLPDVFRLRGQLPGTGDFRTPVRPLHPRHRGHGRRAGRRRAGRRMAGGHDRRRDNLRAAFPALLPAGRANASPRSKARLRADSRFCPT